VANVAALKRPRQEICSIVLGAQSEPWSRSDEEVGELVGGEHVHLGWAGELWRGDAMDKYAEQLRQLRGAFTLVAALLSCKRRPYCVAMEEALKHRIEVTCGCQVGEAWVWRPASKGLTSTSIALKTWKLRTHLLAMRGAPRAIASSELALKLYNSSAEAPPLSFRPSLNICRRLCFNGCEELSQFGAYFKAFFDFVLESCPSLVQGIPRSALGVLRWFAICSKVYQILTRNLDRTIAATLC